MLEFLTNQPPGMIVPILGIVFGVLAGVICAVTHRVAITWQRHKTQEMSASLIESMIVSGMSAEEIERVLNAAGLEDPEHPKQKQSKRQNNNNMAETKIGVKVG